MVFVHTCIMAISSNKQTEEPAVGQNAANVQSANMVACTVSQPRLTQSKLLALSVRQVAYFAEISWESASFGSTMVCWNLPNRRWRLRVCFAPSSPTVGWERSPEIVIVLSCWFALICRPCNDIIFGSEVSSIPH